MLETREVVVCVFYDLEAARDAMSDLRDAIRRSPRVADL
jgi:hypothetical protein